MNAQRKRVLDRLKEDERKKNNEKFYDYFSDPIRTDECNSLLKEFNKIEPARPEDRDECKRQLKEILEPEINISETEEENSSESEEEKEFSPPTKRQRK